MNERTIQKIKDSINESALVNVDKGLITIQTDSEWLDCANINHAERIYEKAKKCAGDVPLNKKLAGPAEYNKIVKSLGFVIDNWRAPIHFLFEDFYKKYSNDSTLKRDLVLLVNAMLFDNEHGSDCLNADNVLKTVNSMEFINSDDRDTITNSFLEALTSKISGKPNMKFILEHYKEIDCLISRYMRELEPKIFRVSNTERDARYTRELEELIDIIRGCLYIDYKVTV